MKKDKLFAYQEIFLWNLNFIYNRRKKITKLMYTLNNVYVYINVQIEQNNLIT